AELHRIPVVGFPDAARGDRGSLPLPPWRRAADPIIAPAYDPALAAVVPDRHLAPAAAEAERGGLDPIVVRLEAIRRAGDALGRRRGSLARRRRDFEAGESLPQLRRPGVGYRGWFEGGQQVLPDQVQDPLHVPGAAGNRQDGVLLLEDDAE